MPICRPWRQKWIYRKAAARRQRLKTTAIDNEIARLVQVHGRRLAHLDAVRRDLPAGVGRALRYIGNLVKQIPGPLDFDPHSPHKAPLIDAMCFDKARMVQKLRSNKALARLFAASDTPVVYALLTAVRREKTIFGIKQEGLIARRDVPQRSVNFDDIALTAVSGTLDQSRRLVRERMMDALVQPVVDASSALQDRYDQLEKEYLLLQSVIASDEKRPETSSGLDDNGVKAKHEEVVNVHTAIEKELAGLKKRLASPDDLRSALRDVLLHPERHLTVHHIRRKLNRLGIVADDSAVEPVNDIAVTEFEHHGGKRWTAVWITVERDVFDRVSGP